MVSARQLRGRGRPQQHQGRLGTHLRKSVGAADSRRQSHRRAGLALRDPARELLRHTIATVAYRAAKATRGAPPDFADFRAGGDVRTPKQIVSHMADLYDWALSLAKGKWDYKQSTPKSWDRELER